MIDKEYEQSQKMIKAINEAINKSISNKKSLIKEGVEDSSQAFSLENIPSLSNTINGWKNNIIENIQSSINFNSFLFYPKDKNIIVNFTIVDINLSVKMKLNDSSTYGLFIWANELQLNDSIMTKIQHIKSSFDNWRNGIIRDNTILNDIQNSINAKK